MNADFDREIDSLLRRSPRTARHGEKLFGDSPEPAAFDRDETGSRNAAGTKMHLDVDELSAYAENALPAETRARYVAHLADCQQCRRIVTGIALASDVAGALEKSASSTPASTAVQTNTDTMGWLAWLASLFAPRGLRYALPVLALLVTGAIIFTVMQTRPRQESEAVIDVAAVKEVDRVGVTGNQTNTAPTDASTPTSANPAQQAESANPTASGGASKDVASKKNESNAPSSVPNDMTANAPAPTGGPPDASSRVADALTATPSMAPTTTAESTARAEQTPVADEDELTRTRQADETRRAPSPQSNELADSASTSKNEPRENKTTSQPGAGGSKAQELPTSRRASPGTRAGDPGEQVAVTDNSLNKKDSGRAVARPPAPKRESDAASNAKSRRSASPSVAADSRAVESSVETRDVSGRRFRRQGSAWVDTAYTSATATTNITRGSEQYRALVADEPELQRIVSQLSGEVIVLWKGRAYRFR
ncbi:MAG: zf-HC2 domain-containing protein [Acidobacteriota bacterium]|nr:zf-HC2 domain-containing protein [Acidobacteriota bacterium]